MMAPVENRVGGLPMHAMAIPVAQAFWTVRTEKQSLPDPVPRPPGRPPGEPIIIKVPPRPPEAPEVDGPQSEQDEDAEIRKPPAIIPEMPPPPAPWDRVGYFGASSRA
jgi:hypothetical protein